MYRKVLVPPHFSTIKHTIESGEIMEANTKEKTSRKKKKQSSNKALKTLLIVLAALVAVLGTLYYFVIYREQQRVELQHEWPERMGFGGRPETRSREAGVESPLTKSAYEPSGEYG